MQFNDLSINIDVSTGNTIRDFNSSVPQPIPPFKSGDKRRILVRLLEPTRIAGVPWREIDVSSYTVKAALGFPTEEFDSGTFTVTFTGDTTAALAYNVSAADLETALNGLASITSAGGVDVTGVDGGPWIIKFRTNGDQDSFVIDTSELVPVGASTVDVVTEGDVSTREEVVIGVEVGMLAYVELTGSLDAANIQISEVVKGTANNNEIQRIDLSNPEPYDGFYTLTYSGNQTTVLIPYDANAVTIQAALEGLTGISAGDVSVSGFFPIFDIEFTGSLANTDIAALTADVSGLIVPTGKSGVLNLNTKELITFFRGDRTKDVYFEIEVSDGAENNINTVVNYPVELIEDVINPSLITPLVIPSVSDWLNDRAVRIDIAHTPEEAEQVQFWANLNVATYASLSAANAAEGAINVLWRNSATGKLQMTTSAS